MNKKKELYKILKFLHTIKAIRHGKRSIILECLDTKSCNLLYKTIKSTLLSSYIGPKRTQYLAEQLNPYKKQLRMLLRSKDIKQKKYILQQIGGPQLDIILHTAIPLLLSTIS